MLHIVLGEEVGGNKSLTLGQGEAVGSEVVGAPRLRLQQVQWVVG